MSTATDNTSQKSVQAFLCHNDRDKPLVRRLEDLLALNGIKSWMDERHLDAGSAWLNELIASLEQAQSIIICLGPHGIGKYQDVEIQNAARMWIEKKKRVLPLILPSCGDSAPEVPEVLKSMQILDLRRDKTDVDPFGRLLNSIDGRSAEGRYRPSVLVLRNATELTCHDSWQRLANECHNTLRRVRVIDDSEPLLEKRLNESLRCADVLVSLLSTHSHDPLPGDVFSDGIAAGASKLASSIGVPVVTWRSESLKLPDDPNRLNRFRTTDTETCLPANLAQHVLGKAEQNFHRRRQESAPPKAARGKRQVVVGYPVKAKDGKRFVRQVAEHLERRDIQCSSLPKWEFVFVELDRVPPLYEAIVVVLTGDDDWLCDCSVALRELETRRPLGLPRIRAFLHKVEDPQDADPIPIRLEHFEEFYGLQDIPKLASKIAPD